jgi:hypothetical protein
VLSPSAEGLLAASPFAIGSRVTSFGVHRRSGEDLGDEPNNGTGRSVFRIGGSVIPAPQEDPSGKRPDQREGLDASEGSSVAAIGAGMGLPGPGGGQTIRFRDEAPANGRTAEGAASPKQ